MAAIEHDRPLAPLTTLELGGAARRFVHVTHVDELREVLREDPAARILGGGSNLVVADAGIDGTVVQLALRGMEVTREGDTALVTAGAGESLQDLVDLSLEDHLAGLECLTGIPGSVGATPIQNVGAYGQEVSQTIRAVEVYERASGKLRWMAADQCGFAYRSSRFKRDPAAHIVLRVRYALAAGAAPNVRYAELERALGAGQPTVREVAEVVYRLRAGKSMVLDPADPNGRSAGSFFTNPVVERSRADAVIARALAAGLAEDASQVPCHPAPGQDGQSEAFKLAAGWLIERAGITKGLRRGNVGVSTRHALSLVHLGGGSTEELLTLAREVRDAVRVRFDITLEAEPTLWGVSL